VPPLPPGCRGQVLRAIAPFLGGVTRWPVRVSVRDRFDILATLVFRRSDWRAVAGEGEAEVQAPAPSPESSPGISPASLREVERNALEAATRELTPTAQLAVRAGYAPGSYFSAAVTRLCRLGLLVREGNRGVRLA
jgi:hypothetical protein